MQVQYNDYALLFIYAFAIYILSSFAIDTYRVLIKAIENDKNRLS